MPNSKEHIAKARHNERFCLSFDLASTPYLDWVVNGIFYSAVHYVDSYFATIAQHPRDHGARHHLINANAKLGNPLFKLYRSLKDDSEDARYDTRIFTTDEVRRDIMPLLNHLKNHLKQYVPQI